MALNILHLSDLHIGNGGLPPAELIAAITMHFPTGTDEKIGLIVITGDIFDATAYHNSVDKCQSLYDEAKNLFKGLTMAIREMQGTSLNLNDVIFVPGNHEVERKHPEDFFGKFKYFLKYFYDEKLPSSGKMEYLSIYNMEHLSVFKKFENEKIIVIGFNSASYNENGETVGEIKRLHLADISKKLHEIGREKGYEEYSIVVLLHHHFYKFEERNKNEIDNSSLVNQESFFKVLQHFNITAIMHGHKHLNLTKRININDNCKHPDKIVTTISCGSTNKDDVDTNNFNIVTIYEPDSPHTLGLVEYARSREDSFSGGEKIILPITKYSKVINSLEKLLELDTGCNRLYGKLNSFGVAKSSVIRFLDETVGKCSYCSEKITENKKAILHMFFVAHYCANSEDHAIVKRIKDIYTEGNIIEDYKFKDIFLGLFTCKNIYELNEMYTKTISSYIQGECSNENEIILIFSLISFYISNLYCTLDKKAGQFFNLKIKNKVDLPVEDECQINAEINNATISISSNEEKRAIDVSVQCITPLAHKVVTLIIKEFELVLTSFEKDFASVGFKMYYLLSAVSHPVLASSKLESYTFSAYIHSLLPLLAGRHIYSDEKVFIRELIQNSIDAINLRKEAEKDFKKTAAIIDITTAEKDGKYILTIQDNGVGMTKYHIERYLTTVGRSFYKSEEFLNSPESDAYKPISQFGIGFLSCFNVSNSIKVQTKHWSADKEFRGYYLDIPNIDGCFFIDEPGDDIREIETGTTIKLLLDSLSSSELKDYIKEYFLNTQYPINFNGDVLVEKNAFLSSIKKETGKLKLFFKIPFSDKEMITPDANNDTLSVDDNSYGIYLYKKDDDLLSGEYHVTCMCNGIKVDKFDRPEYLELLQKNFFDIAINLSSANISLSVSRDTIQGFSIKNEDELQPVLDATISTYLSANESIYKAIIPYFSLNIMSPEKFPLNQFSLICDGHEKLRVGLIEGHTFEAAYNLLQYFSKSNLSDTSIVDDTSPCHTLGGNMFHCLMKMQNHAKIMDIIKENISNNYTAVEIKPEPRDMDMDTDIIVINQSIALERYITMDMDMAMDMAIDKAMDMAMDKAMAIDWIMAEAMAMAKDKAGAKAKARARLSLPIEYLIFKSLNKFSNKKQYTEDKHDILKFCVLVQAIPIFLSSCLTLSECQKGLEIDLHQYWKE